MSCPVCKSATDRTVLRENGYEGRLCLCGTVCVHPDSNPSVDPTADAHSETFYSAYAGMKARWLQELYPRGRVLEVGCGNGHFLAAAKSLGYDVTGLEPDDQRAARTRRRGIEVHRALLEDFRWSGTPFDIVYHCDLLSHFADPVESLRLMTRLVKPNGMVAFEVGTLGGIHPIWYRWIGHVGLPQHRWLYSEHSLQRLLAQADLEVLRMRHFGLAAVVAFHRWLGSAARFRPGIFESIEQFVRYRIGAFSPRIGPATWLVATRPKGVAGPLMKRSTSQ